MITLNGVPINVTIFPDKTSQVWKLPSIDEFTSDTVVNIVWNFESESEFMHLAQLKMLLDTHAVRTVLEITYLPYARQDKAVKNDATFALHTFAHLLNCLHFDEIIINDPHSNVATNLIHNSDPVYPLSEIDRAFSDTKSDIVAYPDYGAVVKYLPMYHYDFVRGEKHRDQQTGRITSYELIGSGPNGKRVLIADDICDGGATFVLLAKALYDAGSTEVNLFVTHGIFSKGLQVLKDAGIKRIFTAKGEVK